MAPNEDRVVTLAGRFKLIILVFGILVLGLGLHSHFQSSWWRNRGHLNCAKPRYKDYTCPGISMENFYVVMLIMTYILSIIDLAASLTFSMNQGILKMADMGFHAFSAVFLLIAAIVFLVSTEQVHHVFGDYFILIEDGKTKLPVLRSEKIAAGSFTIFQALFYGATAFLLFRG